MRYLRGEIQRGSAVEHHSSVNMEQKRDRVYNTMFHVPWRCELVRSFFSLPLVLYLKTIVELVFHQYHICLWRFCLCNYGVCQKSFWGSYCAGRHYVLKLHCLVWEDSPHEVLSISWLHSLWELPAAHRCGILCVPRLLSFPLHSHASQDSDVSVAAPCALEVSGTFWKC